MCWRAQLRGFRFGFAPDAVVLHRRRPTEWARIEADLDTGRGGTESGLRRSSRLAPTLRPSRAALKRIVDLAVLPALKHPRRDHARVAVWNARRDLVMSREAEAAVGLTETRSGDPIGSPLLL